MRPRALVSLATVLALTFAVAPTLGQPDQSRIARNPLVRYVSLPTRYGLIYSLRSNRKSKNARDIVPTTPPVGCTTGAAAMPNS
jgi:hypothetical protein